MEQEANVDRLLQARAKIEEELRQYKTELTVLFTDVVGSTSYFDRYGDTAGLAMLHCNEALARKSFSEFSGRIIKTIGDSVMAEFPAPVLAVRAAAELQRRVLQHNENLPERERFQLRVGINAGLGFRHNGDVYGDVVNQAARITKQTGPAQILVSRVVYELISCEPDLHCKSLGKVVFAGKAEQEEIYEVIWTDPSSYKHLREKLHAAVNQGEIASPGLHLEELAQAAALSPFSLGPGSRIGRYEILSELGRGAMGVVYRAFDPNIGREVAIKTIHLDRSEPEAAARFRREAQAAGILSHPNIVTIYDAADDRGIFYIAMELVQGQTLQQMIAAGPLPLHETISLVEQIGCALDYAHARGIIHRDIKPANIMLSEGRVRVMDFGVAKVGTATATATGQVLGTPFYMSPEQVSGKPVDGRADIFSLGAMLYEMLTQTKPFQGEHLASIVYKILGEQPQTPSLLNPSLHDGLNEVVLKALAKDPRERYQSCQELTAEMKRYSVAVVGSNGFQGSSEGPTESSSLPRTPAVEEARVSKRSPLKAAAIDAALSWRRRGVVAAVLAAVVVVLAVGIGVRQLRRQGSSTSPVPPAPAVQSSVPVPTVTPSQPLSSPPAVAGPSKQPAQEKTTAGTAVVAAPRAATASSLARTRRSPPAPSSAPSSSEAAAESKPAPWDPPAQGGAGRIAVHTQPQGASILIDGERTPYRTPVNFSLAPGKYQITVEHRGFDSQSQQIEVRRDRPAQVQMNLNPNGEKRRLLPFLPR